MLLGANRSNLPAIRAARQAGFVTFVADPHAESPGLREADVPIQMDVRNCDGILAALEARGGVDGIVSMSEVGIRAAAHMSHKLGLPSISETTAEN